MKCPKCHIEVDSDARFCPNCREKLAGAAKGASVSGNIPAAEPNQEKNNSGEGYWSSTLASIRKGGKPMQAAEGETGQNNGDDFQVFISYRRKTGANDARLLQQALKARGYNVFFDYDSLRDGKFNTKIFEAIDKAPIFILILTEGSLDNCTHEDDWVRMEIEYALSLNRKIVPVVPSPCSWSFPDNLPEKLLSIKKEQISELNKTSLFEESVDRIIRDRFPSDLIRPLKINGEQVSAPSTGGTKSKIDKKLDRLDNTKLNGTIDDNLGESNETPSPIKVQNIVHEDRSACDYLKVEYNYNVFAASRYQSAIQLRLTTKGDTLNKLRLFWTFDNDNNYELKEKILDEDLENGVEIPVILQFTKDRPGAYDVHFYFVCTTKTGIVQRFKFNELCPVYDSAERAKAGNFTFFIDNNATHAADIRNNAINIASQKQFTVNQLLDELRKMPQFGTKRLRKTTREIDVIYDCIHEKNEEPSVLSSVSETVMERVLLTMGGQKLFVLGKKSVKVGRSEHKNDFVVQIPGIPQGEKPNSTVSTCHGVMNIAGECVSFKDTSTFGSRISGHGDWFIKEERQLPADCATGLRLGNVKLQVAPCLCERMTNDETCRGCQMTTGNVSSLILKHIDNVPESYLIVPYCCDLGRVLPAADGWTIFHKNGGFVIRTPDRQLHKLYQGMILSYGGQTMEVREFKQQIIKSNQK